jgi:hypothetical protein
MKISKKTKAKTEEPKHKIKCSECGEHWKQAVYIVQSIDGKKGPVKIGLGCPECLPKKLKE